MLIKVVTGRGREDKPVPSSEGGETSSWKMAGQGSENSVNVNESKFFDVSRSLGGVR